MPPVGKLKLSAEQRSSVVAALTTIGVAHRPTTETELDAAAALVAWAHGLKLATPIEELSVDDKVSIIAAMASHRFCGVPDGQRLLTAQAASPAWDTGDLTWRVNTNQALLSPVVPFTIPTVRDALKLAFETWRQALPGFFTFRQVERNADIVVNFRLPLDPKQPTRWATGNTKGEIRFRPAQPLNGGGSRPWPLNDIALAATHEIGHVLGLNHSNVESSLMFPVAGGWAQGPLDPETLTRIKDLYAWNLLGFPDERASAYAPALATTRSPGGFGGGAPAASTSHMVWTGREGHAALSYSRSDNEGRTWSPPVAMQWPAGATPVHGTALTSYQGGDDPAGNQLFLAWAGEREHLWYAPSVDNPADLTAFPLEGHSSDERPALANHGRRVHMVWKSNGDDRVWWGSWERGQWSTVHAIPGLHTDRAPAVVVSPEYVVIVVREPGAGNDGRLMSSRLPTNGGGWWSAPALLAHFKYEADGAYDNGVAMSLYGPAAAAIPGTDYTVAYVDDKGAVNTMRRVGATVSAWRSGLSGPTPVRGSWSDKAPALTRTGSGMMCSWIGPDQRIWYALRTD